MLDAPLGRIQAHALFGEKGRILADQGQFVLDGDAVRNGPGGIEHQVAHVAAEDRGVPIGLAHDDPHVHDGYVLFHHVEAVVRDVDQDVAIAQVFGQPSPALQVGGDLRQPVFRRNVQGGQGAAAQPAVRFEPVNRLEAFEGCLQRGVKKIGLTFRGQQCVSGQGES